MKTKNIPVIFLLLCAFILTGCELAVTNLTPSKVPENPSGIYTISMSARIRDGSVVDSSIVPQIVINGRTEYMHINPNNPRMYDFDYSMPYGQNEVAYYYVIDYQTIIHNDIHDRQLTSDLYTLGIVNRYIQTLESDRAPAGSVITVLGRGFSPKDTIYLGTTPADTDFISSNTLAFTVPLLPSGVSYPVYVKNHTDAVLYGEEFHIDDSVISTNMQQIELKTGEKTELILKIDQAAPAGGLTISITTDIPKSIIMDQAFISEGQNVVSITIEGGEPAQGHLFIEADGFADTILPLYIQGS